ncbi:hypothetical protein LLH00_15275 [bacterium]|nr:hypothetical protein [bacterium]
MDSGETNESLCLTEKLKQEFREKLISSKYNKPKYTSFEYVVDKFISELDSYLPAAKWRLSTEPVDITRGRKKQKEGINALNRAIRHFEEALMIMYPGTKSEDVTTYLSNFSLYADLYKLRDKFVEALKLKSNGRPNCIKTYFPETPGDVNNMVLPDMMQEVIQNIVYIFWMNIGKPTVYRDGPMFEIVRKTLEILNRHQSELYNRIKTAIDTLAALHPHVLTHK